MKKLLFISVILLSAIITFGQADVQKKSKDPKKGIHQQAVTVKKKSDDGIFIHISSGIDEPKKVSMALSLAEKFSETHAVAVFFDVEGVHMVDKRKKELRLEHYTPTHEAIKNILKNGGLVMACPMCLKAGGVEKDQLLPGVKVAKKEAFFDFTKGRIMTLDY